MIFSARRTSALLAFADTRETKLHTVHFRTDLGSSSTAVLEFHDLLKEKGGWRVVSFPRYSLSLSLSQPDLIKDQTTMSE